jgi:uncharacterized repeat protein (TIGR01451 family)
VIRTFSVSRLVQVFTVAIACCVAAVPVRAQLQASATVTATPLNASTYRYEIVLKNTGTTTIGTFWFSWIPGQDFMPSAPSNIMSPLYWSANLTHGSPADGYGIQWVSSFPVYYLPAGQSFAGFSFDSAMTPSQLAAGMLGTSYVYVGAPLADLGFNFVVTTATAAAPQLTVGLSHIGNFTQGQNGAAYTITTRNMGTGAGSGMVTVTDVLPAGFTAATLGGLGWTCVVASATCTRLDSLGAGGVYPPITLTTNVPPGAASPVTNQAMVSGGGAASSMASDITTILASFVDVSLSDAFLPAIDLLREYGITSGCSSAPAPPQFCPSANVTRSQMATFVVRSIMGGDSFTYTLAPYFSDVPANHPFFPWIQKLRDLGVTSSCGSTAAGLTYCPDDPVTRGQMAVFIIRARFGSSTAFNYSQTPFFTDVPQSNGFFPWVQKLKQLGITSSCGSNAAGLTYCPDDPVTRGEMAVFVMRGAFNQLLPANTPMIISVSPAAGPRAYTMMVTLTGQNTNWVNGTTQVSTGAGITVTNVVVTNSTTLTAQLVIAANAVTGPYSLTATTVGEEATLPNGFTVQ